MADQINQRKSEFVQVPRELYSFIRQGGRSLVIENFFEAIAKKISKPGELVSTHSQVDDLKLYFGTDQDYCLYYDGTDLYLQASNPSDFIIDCGAGKTLELARPVYDDQQINISSVRLPASNAPTWTSYVGSQVLAFSGSGTNTIYFTAQLSHKYKVGEDIDFHIHFVPVSTTVANHRWVLTYSWVDIGGTFPAATTVTTVLPTPGVFDKHTYGEIAGTIDGSGRTGISSILLCSLARTGGHVDDTYNDAIYLIAADFHFPIDTIGSRQEDEK